MRRPLISALLLSIVSACTPARTGTAAAPDHNQITREQLTDHRFKSVYEAVEGLHRNWLLTRGSDSINLPTQVKVYLDNLLLGGVETLRDITPSSISYVQYFDGLAASTRWGLDHGSGVIYVSTRPEKLSPQ
jgi:hypothetical protein